MKQTITLFSFTLFLIIYSFNSDRKDKKTDVDIIQENQTTTNPQNDDCNFSIDGIGKNSSDSSHVELIGLFENILSTGEHNYGYALSLWKVDEKILGFFNHYEGDIEPNRSGIIIKGNLNNDSLNITVWTKGSKGFSNWQQSDILIFSFLGKLSKGKLIGYFSVFNCTNETMQDEYNEQVELNASDMWVLKSFKNTEDWKESNSYKLDYEK